MADGPDALIASSFAPMGSLEEKEGGAVLSGYWSFASGVDHAHWLILGARRQGRPVLVLAPRSEVQIKDDWKVIGLAGSGSKSLSVEGCWVPEDLILDMAAVESGETPGSRLSTAALFHLPWRPLFSYAFIPPILGATLASVDEAHLYFKGRKSAFTDQAFRERPLAWYAVAQSRGEVDNALTLMRQDLAELEDATARQGLTRDLVLRASFRPALIAKLCRSSVDRLFHASGGSALYDSHPLQSLFRDIQAMTQHPAVNYEIACETYGRALME